MALTDEEVAAVSARLDRLEIIVAEVGDLVRKLRDEANALVKEREVTTDA